MFYYALILIKDLTIFDIIWLYLVKFKKNVLVRFDSKYSVI